MFNRASASLGANWSLHDLRHMAAYRMTRDPGMPLAGSSMCVTRHAVHRDLRGRTTSLRLPGLARAGVFWPSS